MLSLLVAAALAQDHGHPAVLLPGAGALEGGKGHVAVGAALADVLTGDGLVVVAGGPLVTGVVGIGSRVAVNGAFGGGFVGFDPFNGFWAVPTPHGALGVRVVAAKLGALRVAPFAFGTVGSLPDKGLDVVVGGGVAAKLDVRRIGLDVSIPAWARLYQGGEWSDPAPWRVTEGGVSYQVNRDMRVRLGMASFVPVISARQQVGHAYVDVSCLWLIDGYVLAQGGWAW